MTTHKAMHEEARGARSKAEKLFASPHAELDEPRANADKVAGNSDSSRNGKSTVKAAGGTDTGHTRDGG